MAFYMLIRKYMWGGGKVILGVNNFIHDTALLLKLTLYTL